MTFSRGTRYAICYVPKIDIWFAGWGMTVLYDQNRSESDLQYAIDDEDPSQVHRFIFHRDHYAYNAGSSYVNNFFEFRFLEKDIAPILVKAGSRIHIMQTFVSGEDYYRRVV